MPRLILANQSTAAKRRCYFDLRDATDGITAETGEGSGQPQISTNGGAFTNTGIGTLTHIGSGRYYADLTQGAVATAGDIIETRYKSANTAETPGDTFQVVAFDPDSTSLGLDLTGKTISAVSGAVGSVTGAVASVTADVGITQAGADKVWGTTTRAITDKAGFSLSAGGVQAIWDALTSALTTVGSIGKRIADNLDAAISSRMATFTYTAPSNSAIAAIQTKTDQLNFTGTDVKATLDGETVVLTDAGAVLDLAAGVETGLTLRQAMRLLVAAEAGKLSGAATTTISIRNFGDSKNRIVATVDSNGNRSAITYDLT